MRTARQQNKVLKADEVFGGAIPMNARFDAEESAALYEMLMRSDASLFAST